MQVIFKINGTDFANRLEDGGLQRTRNDLDDDSAGRDLAGNMDRARIATKITLQCTCRPMTQEEIQPLLSVIENNEFVSVTYLDPAKGEVTKTMYCNTNPATCMRNYEGTLLWDSISFTLVEK